jgi:hypothetical protein
VARLQMFAQSEETPMCSLDSSLYFQTPVNPCRVSKDSEQSFCILTQHVTIVSVALVRRINFLGKLSSDIPT